MWRLFAYDVPTFPAEGAPRRPDTILSRTGKQSHQTAAEEGRKESAAAAKSRESSSPGQWVIGDRFPGEEDFERVGLSKSDDDKESTPAAVVVDDVYFVDVAGGGRGGGGGGMRNKNGPRGGGAVGL